MNKRKGWFPKGYKHSKRSTLKSKLRQLLRNKPREEEGEDKPQIPCEKPRTFSELRRSSTNSITKSTTQEDIEKQDEKKLQLKKILTKFRHEIANHEKSASNSFEADPYVLSKLHTVSRHSQHSLIYHPQIRSQRD